MSQALTPTYTCKHCRKVFTLTGPPIIGEQVPQRLGRVAKMLLDHLAAEHKEAVIQTQLAGQQFSGWLLPEQFTHTDAELARESNQIRLKVRQFTRRINITDETIDAQIQRHLSFLAGPEQDTVRTILRTLRDSLDEVQPTE